jgi:hypothetical protein
VVYVTKKSQFLSLVTTEIEQIDFILIVGLAGLYMYKRLRRRGTCYNRYTTCPAGHGLPTVVVG